MKSISTISYLEPALAQIIRCNLAGEHNEKYPLKTTYLNLYRVVYLNLSSSYKFSEHALMSNCPDFDSGYMDKTILALLRNQYIFKEVTSMRDDEFLKGIYMLLWAYSNQFDFFNEYDKLVNNRFIKRNEVPKKYKFKNEPFFPE